VVNIYTTKTVAAESNPLLEDPFFRRFFNRPLLNRTQEQRSLGSGVIMSGDGYILTNAHVINDADQILVMLFDGRQAVAEVVGVDSETDLAVLSVEMSNLKAINIGDPNSAQVGDVTLAIGNPFGFGQTVTQGIISATGRNLLDLSSLVNFLQTDAAINDGNSGGALVDAYGNLLGINSRKLESTGSVGLGFAIPADVAIKVVKDIVEQGRVVRGWLGIEARQLSEEAASSLGLRRSRAMVITGLYPGGPGHRAGLEVGDVLVKLNGREIIDGRRVISMIANAAPGSKLDFEILRRGQSLTVTAEVDERPEQPI
jgi:serine protease DegS